jgi:hypothetical protein
MSAALAHQVQALRAEVRERKAAIRRHREALGQAAARLAALEADCRRLGVALILEPQLRDGEGRVPHGHDDQSQKTQLRSL